MWTLVAGGADVVLAASNPLSTQDDVAASLVAHFEVPVFAIKGEDNVTYYRHLRSALDVAPNITMDDGADLLSTLHKERTDLLPSVTGGTEETTTGVIRLRAMAKDGVEISRDCGERRRDETFFDNRYEPDSRPSTASSANQCAASGRVFVVGGYGQCSRGIANRAGMGHV
jgi:adenosylhomocysteinase